MFIGGPKKYTYAKMIYRSARDNLQLIIGRRFALPIFLVKAGTFAYRSRNLPQNGTSDFYCFQ